MKILLLTPGINKKFNDNYHAYKYITENKHSILVISNMENILKGAGVEFSPETESDGNISIHRLFKTLKEQRTFYLAIKKYKTLKEIAKKFKPHIIFCENSINMPIAVKIKKDFRIPIVLRLEYLFSWNNPYDVIGHQRFLKNKITGDMLGKIVGFLCWKWLRYHSDEIISHYPGDRDRTIYIPWPGKETVFKEKITRHQNRAVFIGSFDVHKNFNEFTKALPELFSKTPLKEFYFVGSGDYSYIVDELRKLFPDKIRHINTMSRDECLKLIGSSYFCYSPAVRGGWGFIGDAWAMKTPMVVAHNHYDFKDNVDSIVAGAESIAERINRLYSDSNYYEKIVSEGYRRFRDNHSAEKVGQRYLDVCFKALSA